MFSLVRRLFTFLQRIADALERIAAAAGTSILIQCRRSAARRKTWPKEDAARFVGVDVAAVEQLIRTRKIG